MSTKGFIFTVDAVFSLIIAGIAASMLLYISAQAQPILQAPSVQAYSLMQGLLSMRAAQAAAAIPVQYLSPFVTVGGTSAAQFGGQGYVSVGSGGLPLGNGARSVFAWINWDGSTASWETIFGYGTSGSDTQYSGLELLSGSGNYLFFEGWNDGWDNFAVTPGKWHLVGYTYSGGSQDNLTLYYDGQHASATLANALDTALYPTSYPAIGQQGVNQPGGSRYFTGSISNVQVYDASLSPQEAAALYSGGMGALPVDRSHLVGWWPLNGNADDYSGSANNGTASAVPFAPTGSVAFPGVSAQLNSSMLQLLAGLYTGGQSTYADMIMSALGQNDTGIFVDGAFAPSLATAQFNGQSSSVTTSAPVSSGAGAVSASLWFKVAAWPLQDSYYYNMLVSDSGSCGTDGFYIASRGVNSETLVSYSGGTNPGDVNLDPIFATGSWNNLVFVWNSTGAYSSNQTIYVDGRRVYNRTVAVPVPALDNAVSLGGGSAPCWGPLYLNGSLANVQLYSGALSSQQAAMLYSSGIQGLPVSGPALAGWWPLMGDTNDYSGGGIAATSQDVGFADGGYAPASLGSAYSVSVSGVPLPVANSAYGPIANVSVGVWR